MHSPTSVQRKPGCIFCNRVLLMGAGEPWIYYEGHPDSTRQWRLSSGSSQQQNDFQELGPSNDFVQGVHRLCYDATLLTTTSSPSPSLEDSDSDANCGGFRRCIFYGAANEQLSGHAPPLHLACGTAAAIGYTSFMADGWYIPFWPFLTFHQSFHHILLNWDKLVFSVPLLHLRRTKWPFGWESMHRFPGRERGYGLLAGWFKL